MRRHELPAREWAVLGPLLDAHCRKQGGATTPNRLFISAILWRVRTGIPWRDLPERFGHWNSVARRFARGARKKVWHRLFGAIQEPDRERVLVDSTSRQRSPPGGRAKKSCAQAEALGRSRNGLTTKVHAAVDALGTPFTCTCRAGRARSRLSAV